MTLPILFCDLDQTLIYSLHQLHRRGLSTAGTMVAEEYQNLPLSFITLPTWVKLRVNAGKTFNLIPTTTRTLAQYQRIQFPNVKIDTAVVLNGAQIIVDGVLDKDWSQAVAAGVAENEHSPQEVFELLEKGSTAVPHLRTVRSADNMFAYIVTEYPESPEADALTNEVAAQTGYVRSKQGRKTYLIPKTVSKGRAVAELVSRLKPDVTFASGDSLLDFTMIPEVTHFIHPSHGDELEVTGNIVRTQAEGPEVAEEILDFVLQTLRS